MKFEKGNAIYNDLRKTQSTGGDLTVKEYNVAFSKGTFAKISLGVENITLTSNPFEKNSKRRTFS